MILTCGDAIASLHYVTVAPLSRTIRGIDSEVILEPSDGVPTRSAITLDKIFTVEHDLLVQPIATLSAQRMNEVWEVLPFVFDLPFLTFHSSTDRTSVAKPRVSRPKGVEVMPGHDVQASSWVQRTSGVCGGEPCIRRTRYTVSGLVQWRRLGLSDTEIRERHPDLTQADLETALAYYDQHREEIDRAIQENEDA